MKKNNTKIQFLWEGKEEALQECNTPPKIKYEIPKTVDGNEIHCVDNLDFLKNNLERLRGKIKMIYIDPPYNTGRDFIYNDKIHGRGECKHSKWLSFMYPRLMVAREMLREDGVIFISIDDNEVHHLRLLMNEVFGEEFVDGMVWQKMDARYDKNTNAKVINRYKEIHEYILIGYKNTKKEYFFNKIKKLPDWNKEAKNPDNDKRGGYEAGIISYEEGHENEDKNSELYYSITLPSGRVMTRHFFVTKEEFAKLRADNRIYFPKDGDGVPRLKVFQNEEQEYKLDSILRGFGTSQTSKNELDEIFGIREIFDTPKPTKMIKELIRATTAPNDLILDFFAGSGTTGQAVMELNQEEIDKQAKDGLLAEKGAEAGGRKFILVQLPEKIDEKKEAFKAGYRVISDITMERVRRAGEKYKSVDVNFKVFNYA